MNRTVTVAGQEYKVGGCLPRTTKVGDGTFPTVPDDFLIPRDEWDDFPENDLDQFVWHIVDQARQNSCCGCAGVGTLMLGREMQGLDRMVLSQAVPYHLGNGGRDQGMGIDTCLRVLLEHGTCPVDVVDQYDWRKRDWPDNWAEIAADYKPFKFLDCPSYDHAVSMGKRGHPILYGADGHAVVRIGFGKHTKKPDLNSWSKAWKFDGLGQWVDERGFKNGMRQYGAWALMFATDPPNDGDL